MTKVTLNREGVMMSIEGLPVSAGLHPFADARLNNINKVQINE